MKTSNKIYLENCSNKIVQLFSLFSNFLFVVLKNSKNDYVLNNVLVDSRHLYIRSLIDFFNNKKKGDDLTCNDFIDSTHDYNIQCNSIFRNLLNKQTIHFTDKRGTFSIDNDEEHKRITIQLIKNINHFLDELEIHIKDKYKEDFYDPNAQNLYHSLLSQITEICLSNAIQGIVIEI